MILLISGRGFEPIGSINDLDILVHSYCICTTVPYNSFMNGYIYYSGYSYALVACCPRHPLSAYADTPVAERHRLAAGTALAAVSSTIT